MEVEVDMASNTPQKAPTPAGPANVPPPPDLDEELDLSEEDNETEPGAAALPPEAEPIGLKIEKEFDEEDDFADGRSSGGLKTRAEEDEWGRGTDPDERPFEESDVPPRTEASDISQGDTGSSSLG
jgi:hypothetical protein